MATVYLSGCTSVSPRNDRVNLEDEGEEDKSSAASAEEYRADSGATPSGSPTISNTTGRKEVYGSASSKYDDSYDDNNDSYNDNHLDSAAGADTDPIRDTYCIEEGALRCVTTGSAEREECRNGFWVNSDPCDDGEVCDPSDSDYPGSCKDESSLCLGSAGRFICNGDTMIECDENAVAIHDKSCLSRQHCLVGLASGMCAECIPKQEYLCDDSALKVCAEDGMGFELYEECPSADACIAEVGACEAVGGCQDDSDCSTTRECRKAICVEGECTTTIDEEGACGDEKDDTCGASGECAQCYTDDDCDDPKKQKCDPFTKTCVECVEDKDCDKEGWSCKSNRCEEYEPVCGNGILEEGEQCDSGDANFGPCDSNCQVKLCGPQTCVYEGSSYCYCSTQEWCVWNQQEGNDEKWGCVLMCTTDADCYPEAFVNTGYSVKCVSQGCYYPCDPKNGNDDCPADMKCRADKYTGFTGCSI